MYSSTIRRNIRTPIHIGMETIYGDTHKANTPEISSNITGMCPDVRLPHIFVNSRMPRTPNKAARAVTVSVPNQMAVIIMAQYIKPERVRTSNFFMNYIFYKYKMIKFVMQKKRL